MDNLIDRFKTKVREESKYSKWLDHETIQMLDDYFLYCTFKKKYDRSDNDALDIALSFFYQYFKEYYGIISKGLSNGKIMISEYAPGNYTLPDERFSYVKLAGLESDMYIIIHELAHYIDVSLHPRIIREKKWVYAETVPFFVERTFESKEYQMYYRVINTRKTNRNHSTYDMLQAIKLMLKYEDHYRCFGNIDDILDEGEVKRIMSLRTPNLVNSFLKYPIAILYSAYMLENNISLQKRLDTRLDSFDIHAIMRDEKVKALVFNEM